LFISESCTARVLVLFRARGLILIGGDIRKIQKINAWEIAEEKYA